MEALAIPFLLLVGSLLALQAAANVQLSTAVGSSFGASTLQLGIGALVLLALAAIAGALGALGLIGDAEPWTLAGGLGSALYITAGILLFPRLGALVAVGVFIAGQMLASLLLAASALGVARETRGAPASRRCRGLGGHVADRPSPSGKRSARQRGTPAYRLAPPRPRRRRRPAGSGRHQRSVADRARRRRRGRGLLVRGRNRGDGRRARRRLAAGGSRPQVAGLRRVPWWGWLGGLCGATYVTAVFMLMPEIGAAPVVVLTVAGQQLSSVVIDRYGLLRLPPREISPRRLTGVAVLLAGVALIAAG